MLWNAKEARLCGVRVSRPGCRELSGLLPGLRLPDLGWGRRPKLHGMQGVTAGIGLAVPRPADPVLVAEDGERPRRIASAFGAGQ